VPDRLPLPSRTLPVRTLADRTLADRTEVAPVQPRIRGPDATLSDALKELESAAEPDRAT